LRYDYTYTGDGLETREIGLRTLLRPEYDEINWRRWSEWGDVFPEESISRTVGHVDGSCISPGLARSSSEGEASISTPDGREGNR
jgi:hypothetical protein